MNDDDARALLAKMRIGAFNNGVEAMRTVVIAWLMARGHFDLASGVLQMATPKYSEPIRETVTIANRDS